MSNKTAFLAFLAMTSLAACAPQITHVKEATPVVVAAPADAPSSSR